jgi:CRISPR/Cas system-associated endonuclease Cas1
MRIIPFAELEKKVFPRFRFSPEELSEYGHLLTAAADIMANNPEDAHVAHEWLRQAMRMLEAIMCEQDALRDQGVELPEGTL